MWRGQVHGTGGGASPGGRRGRAEPSRARAGAVPCRAVPLSGRISASCRSWAQQGRAEPVSRCSGRAGALSRGPGCPPPCSAVSRRREASELAGLTPGDTGPPSRSPSALGLFPFSRSGAAGGGTGPGRGTTRSRGPAVPGGQPRSLRHWGPAGSELRADSVLFMELCSLPRSLLQWMKTELILVPRAGSVLCPGGSGSGMGPAAPGVMARTSGSGFSWPGLVLSRARRGFPAAAPGTCSVVRGAQCL